MPTNFPAPVTPAWARIARRVTAIGVVVVTAAACGGGGADTAVGPSGGTPLQASGDFRITVSAGTRPTFTWPGVGGAIVVSLSPHDPSFATTLDPYQWDLYPDVLANSSRSVTSPVTYGTRQSGTTNVLQPNPRTLVSGKRYLVVVVRDDNRSATQEFIP